MRTEGGGRQRRAWVVVLAASAFLAVNAGLPTAFSVLVADLEAAFAASRAQVTGIYSMMSLAVGIAAPLIGRVQDRYGALPLLAAGVAMAGVGLAATSLSSRLWQLYLWYGFAFGLGISALGSLTAFPMLRGWFHRRHGTAVGLADAGSGLGILVLVPLAHSLVERLAWRDALRVAAAAVVAGLGVVLAAVAAVTRREAEGGRGAARARKGVSASRAGREGARRGEQAYPQPRRSIAYLQLAAFCAAVVNQSVKVHYVPQALLAGHSAATAASLLGLVGLFDSLGRIAFGALGDRIGYQKAHWASVLAVASGLSLGLLDQLAGPHRWVAYTAAVLVGLGCNAASPLLFSALFAHDAGAHIGRLYGSIRMGTSIGAALGPVLGAYLYDVTKSYVWSDVGMVAAALGGAVWFGLGTRCLAEGGARAVGSRADREGGRRGPQTLSQGDRTTAGSG